MRIDFYYWGMQCPIHQEILDLLKKYSDVFNIETYNIEGDFSLAKERNMYYPFLTVVDEMYRYFAPLTRGFLEQLRSGERNLEKPYIIPFGETVYEGELVPLTNETIDLIAPKCTMSCSTDHCKRKEEFLSKYCDGIYGLANLDHGTLIGGVEFMPSICVPYDIPRNKENAFITCIYHSSTEFDYKSYPLRELERYLRNSYRKLYAITDELGTFPNGNLEWFLKRGYKDEGVVAVEEGYCKLHMVSKEIAI